jgi:hypothetical protein
VPYRLPEASVALNFYATDHLDEASLAGYTADDLVGRAAAIPAAAAGDKPCWCLDFDAAAAPVSHPSASFSTSTRRCDAT